MEDLFLNVIVIFLAFWFGRHTAPKKESKEIRTIDVQMNCDKAKSDLDALNERIDRLNDSMDEYNQKVTGNQKPQ